MATPAMRKAPALEDSGWTKSPTPNSATSSRNARTRTRGSGRAGREGVSVRSPVSGGGSARGLLDGKAIPGVDGATLAAASKSAGEKNASPPKSTRRNGRVPVTPMVTVEAPTPTTDAFSTPALSSSQRRRRGSARTPSPVQAKSVSPTTSNRNSADTQPATRNKQAGKLDKLDRSKDVPPHLMPSTDITPLPVSEQQDVEVQAQVDTLVEHMRSTAIHRPTSPTTHIDWAVDEDDTLPDLNDWGYDAKQGTLEPESVPMDVISPILENSLKSLPILGPIDFEGSDHSGSQTIVVDTVIHLLDQVKEEPAGPASIIPQPIKAISASSRPHSPEKAKSRRGARARGPKASTSDESTAQAEALPKREARITGDTSSNKAPAGRNDAPSASSPLVSALPETTKDKVPRSGLSASIHAPKSDDDTIRSRSSLGDVTTTSKDSASATPRTPRNARERHARLNSVHTVEATTTGGAAHTRTQSAPVVIGRRGPRTPGAARPVIAGSAISMLAKTLGSPQRSPQRNPSPSHS